MMTKLKIGRQSVTAAMAMAVAGALMGGGCSTARPTVDRIQPDYIDKNDLIPNQYKALTTTDTTPQTVTAQMLAKEPVFYTQNTLIAKPTTTGFTGLTSYSQSDKIRWQVTEHSLIARQSYEFDKNSPGGANGIGQNVQTGDVVAIFAITEHFDIRRDYNSTTGEELNVIVENTADRPWYQRQYMHVDWSQNLVTGYNSIFMEQEWGNQLLAEPIPVFVNTPNDPNAPVFQYSGSGNSRHLDYFDIVNQATLHPETANLGPGYDSIPVCFLGEGETDCAPAQVTMRLAFRRVDPLRDYEPASLTEALPDATGTVQAIPHLNMERFGFFDVTRIGWDPTQHNTLDTQRMHIAARHNLWLHHHALAFGNATATGCNVDADCAASDGSNNGQVCQINDTQIDSTHRGVCGGLAYAHVANDLACATDDDCRQFSDRGGVSRSATCDTAAPPADGSAPGTCGEHYYRCTSDTDCVAATGSPRSTCDLAVGYTRADNRGLCLMPFAWRQVRPIAYHESNNYPDYMQPVTEQIVTEWNSAFVGAVTAARQRECELAKSIDPSTMDPASNPCAAAAVTGAANSPFGPDAQFIYVGCHSPVWGPDAGAGQHSQADVDATHAKGWDLASCGPQGTAARLGDLRYNMIGAITDQDTQGYWGLANIAADPETGEMVAGRGAVWQTITDYYSNQVVEYIQLLNGDLSPALVDKGADLVSSMKALGTGQTPSRAILDSGFATRGLQGAISGVKDGIEKLRLPDAGWLKPGSGLAMLTKDPNHPGALDIGFQRLLGSRLLGDGTDAGSQRLSALQGSALEGKLMNQAQASLAPTATLDTTGTLPATLAAASPLRGMSNSTRHMIERIKADVSAFQCGKEAGFNDDLLLGLAQRLAKGDPISCANADDAPVCFGRDWNFKNGGGAIDYNLMQQYAAQFIHHGVLAHELGHSLGQRHNFTASADAINYNDNYWKVRSAGHAKGLRPRYEYLADPADGKYYSNEEIAGRVDEWSYSSVMDYKGLNEDAHGIGRYDHAFIKNGYVNLVEAFKTVPDVNKALVYGFNTQGNGFSTPLDLTDWQNGGAVHGMHYTQIPDIYGKRPDGTPNIQEDNRYNVFLNETTAASVAGWGPPSFSNATLDNHVLVPYRFDSDERAGLVWQDQRYDAGPDGFESLHYVASHLIDYYFMNSYARLRTGFSTQKYVARIWSRYLDQFRQTTQLMAFDLIQWQDFFGNSPGYDTYLNDPAQFGGYINQTAMNMTADTMVSILTMPELSYHKVEQQFDGSNMLVQDQLFQDPINIQVNDGRGFESTWRADVGFWWYDMLDRAGAYYDKTMMLQAMTDPTLYLLQRDTPVDIRLFQLNFYTMFPNQMVRLFGSILSEDNGDFAPIVDTTNAAAPVIQRPHLATLNGTGAAATGRTIDGTHIVIDPQDHFTMQLWTAILGAALFPATYDQRYMDFARLWVDGSVESISIDPTKTVAFVDPFSGVTYRALHLDCTDAATTGNIGCSSATHLGGGTKEAGVAARVLLHIQDIDAARIAAAGDPAKAAALQQQETQYLDLVNVMRSTTQWFGQGFAAAP